MSNFLQDILHLVVTLAILVKISHGQSAAYVCKHTNVTGSEFEVVFKYFRGGNTQATSLISYDAAAQPNTSTAVGGAACSTQTVEDDIFTLQYSVDVDADLPCGVSQDLMSPSLYIIAIVADGTSTYFTFACNTSDLQLSNEVTVDSFATGHLMNTAEITIEHTLDAKLELCTPDGRSVSSVRVGDNVKLQFSYNINNTKSIQDDPSPDTSSEPYIPDNIGIVFHTAYPLPANNFTYKIYTRSENLTDVQVFFSFNGNVEVTAVQTSQLAPYVGNYSFDYVPTATSTNWTIINFGLKIQSLGEEIYVIVDIDDGQHEMVLQPDDVFGNDYRFFADGDNASCLIVGTESNTAVTFDLTNFGEAGVEIAGIFFPSGTEEATVVIHEYDAIEMMCSDRCQTHSIKSNKSVAVLCGSSSVIQIPETNKLYREFILTESLSTKRYKFFELISGDISTNVEYTVENTSKSLAGIDVGLENTSFASGKHLSSTDPILIVQESFHSTAVAQNFMVVPSIIQWSTQFYFYTELGRYTFLFTTVAGTTIYFSPSNQPNCSSSGSSKSFTSDSGVSYKTTNFERECSTEGWITFHTGKTGVGFGVYAVRWKNPPIPIMPFGMSFPCVDKTTGDIVSCNSSQTSDTSPTNRSSGGSQLFQTTLMPDKLTVSDTRSSSGQNVITLHRKGCNTNEAGSSLPLVTPFQRQAMDSDRLVTNTGVFKMFRFRKSPDLFFQLTISVCPAGELGSCTTSCTGREKRSTESHHVDLHIKVTDDIDDDIKSGKRQVRCESTSIYWIPHIILLMIIIIEVLATSYFLMKKWKLKQS